jgi:sulfate/thiosulfate transport system ATP-binding protein
MSILIENVSKKFENISALQNINLEIKTGSLTALVGPSGSGKSTLLRIVAGFEKPDNGRIWLAGNDSTYQNIQQREIGFVFQNYALFPNLTVFENIAFGLKIKKIPQFRINARVKELLELIQLETFSEAYPYQLSGGQRQRVALARAIAIEPKLLLLDEPFGALDPKVRKDLREWLKKLHSEVALTTLLVTHDQQEAMEVADQIVVFKNGKVEQFGTPQEIYDSPATPFVMNFVGTSNCISSEKTNLDTTKKIFETDTDFYYRPHGFVLHLQKPEDKANPIKAKLEKIVYGESFVKLELELLLDSDQNSNTQSKKNNLLSLTKNQKVGFEQPNVFRLQMSRKEFQKLLESLSTSKTQKLNLPREVFITDK